MKNGVYLEMDVCDLNMSSKTYECRYKKNVYKDDVLVKCLGFHRGTIAQPMETTDKALDGKTSKEKGDIIAVQQKYVDDLLLAVEQIQSNQVDSLEAEKAQLLEQIELREAIIAGADK